ncbi:lipocalin family protein [Rikenella microfusus]|uniref:lipocalin family protein n=1 Tax=Rikenella microfusus TaxID=28139 RepID=UPI001D26BF9F|nr:lipocalin family protein [Rikenella microfusus]HJE87443.1 lipocalin family protein [Rikenella microfusus]
MKKNLFFPAAATVTALALASCGSKPAAPQTVEGAVLDASMNNITLVTTAGDTLNISTMNADPAKVPGVTVGDSVSVTCAETDADGVKVMQAQELTVKSGSSNRRIQGEWTEPNPIDSAAVQGFRLNPDGTAESIGMATLQITAWTLTDGKTLILRTTSIGNKQTIEGQDTLTVDKLDADSLVLSNGSGYVQWRLARQQ